MDLGAGALAPPSYVAFCERRPLDCGGDAGQVLAQAHHAEADRTALLAMLAPSATRTPSSLRRPLSAPEMLSAPRPAKPELLPVAEPLEATVRPLELKTQIDVLDPDQRAALSEAGGLPAMTPDLWATLNRVNAKINHAIIEQTDERTYGKTDYWNTPIENGLRYGDCEDYVLEKQRALLAAGVARRALNIALVTTPWGESHAVLLVSTGSGEFVLDNLSPWVKPWREAGYLWRQRQVNGEPFHWVMIEDPQLSLAIKDLSARKLTLAAVRDEDAAARR